MAVNTHIHRGKKKTHSQVNDLNCQIMTLEKEEKTEPKASKRKEIIRISVKINEIECRNTIEKINNNICWFFKNQ